MSTFALPTYDSIAAALRIGEWHTALELARARLTENPYDQRALFYFIPAASSCGIRDDVARLTDFDRLLWRRVVETVPGFASAADYHSALIRGLKQQASPGAQHCRTVRMTEMGDFLSRPLQRLITREAEDFVTSLSDDRLHPVVAGAPRDFEIVAWINVLLQGEFKALHLHNEGWLSGAYYFHISDPSPRPNLAGCLRLGGYDEALKTNAPPPEIDVFPRLGELILYPSYLCRKMQPAVATARTLSVEFYLRPIRR